LGEIGNEFAFENRPNVFHMMRNWFGLNWELGRSVGAVVSGKGPEKIVE